MAYFRLFYCAMLYIARTILSQDVRRDFRPISCYISATIQDTAVVTMECQ